MAKTLQQKHWLVHVLRRAGIEGADDVVIDPGVPPAEAWMEACDATGLSQDQLATHVGDYFRLDVAVLDAADAPAIKLVPEKIARQYSIFPLKENDRLLTVATSDPTDFAAEQALGFISGRKAVFEVAPPPFILEAITRAYSAGGGIESLLSRVREATVEELERVLVPDASVEDLAMAPGDAVEATEAPGDNGDLAPEDTAGLDERSFAASMSLDRAMAVGTGGGEGPILVVDDDPEDRLLVRTVLQKHGFEVEEARDGDEALEQVGAGKSHALVVLDLEMPTMGGREVLAALRSSPHTAGLPVIVLTGSPDPADEYRLMEEGADDYLRKPLDPPRFIARVKAMLRRARMA